MNELTNILLVSIALSMDTFSVALSIGTLRLRKIDKLIFTLLVGLFHFLMPYFGNMLGTTLISIFKINAHHLLGGLLLILGIRCYIETKETKDFISLNIISIILLAISVSLDSFTTGIGIKAITDHIMEAMLLFSIISSLFTITGFKISNIAKNKLGDKTRIISIGMLITLGSYYLCQ